MDLNSFTTCINFSEHTFFTIYPKLNKTAKENITRLEKSLDEHLWIFGVCLLNCSCDTKQVKYIFDKVNFLFMKTFQFYTDENI